MNTQIELKDNEIPAWAFYENGEGLLSLIFFATSPSHARPIAALLNIYPCDLKGNQTLRSTIRNLIALVETGHTFTDMNGHNVSPPPSP